MRSLICLLMLVAVSTAQADMAEHARRATTAGIDVVTYHSTVKDVVEIVGAMPGGDAMGEGGNIAIPTLSGMMLDRGTKGLDKFAISDKLNNVGAQVSFAVNEQSLEVRAKCLRKDLGMVIGLIASELRTPALAPAEFAKVKQEFAGAVQSSSQNTGERAREAFSRAVYPEGHPNRPHTWTEYISAAKAANLEDVKAFQGKFYGPKHFTLVLVGDVSDEEARQEISKAFEGWSGGGDYIHPAQPAKAVKAETVTVPLAEKPSVTVILGQATGLRYKDPDSLALRLGTAALGRGFTGRLMGTVREKEGLTYGIGTSIGEDSITDGSWEISASFAPSLMDKGIASTRRELTKWWSDGVTEEELNSHREGLIGTYFVGLATTGGIANQLLANLLRGYDVGWLDEYPKAMKALTRAQVNGAIKTHLNPSSMVLVEAGTLPAAK